MIEEGSPAPDFELTNEAGESLRLSDLRGKPVVLYFYPKDDTPGCATQACGFRDAHERFEEQGAVILGVSPDDESSHVAFKERYGLPFTLLVDTDHRVAQQYGVWVQRERDGKKFMGINRSTFIVDHDGTVVRALYGVDPERNADDVLEVLAG